MMTLTRKLSMSVNSSHTIKSVLIDMAGQVEALFSLDSSLTRNKMDQ